MKLSDAILLGSTMSGQAFYELEDSSGKRCAIGAALAAMGLSATTEAAIRSAFLLWPQICSTGKLYACPACIASRSRMGYLLVHLNDAHRWTREQIANYAAQFDPQEVTSSEHSQEQISADHLKESLC